MYDISENTNLKTACVTRKGSRYFYPKTIPRERKSFTQTYLITMAIVFLGCYVFSIEFYFMINLIYRLELLMYEKDNIVSRYKGDYRKVIKTALHFEARSIIICILCTLYCVHYLARYGWPDFQKEFWIINLFIFFLHKTLDLDNNPINDSLGIARKNGLDYGSGMAYSFFYGYLNYILPKSGDVEKNLKELMQDYESTNRIEFECYKIFMLIPKSLECPVNIADLSKLEMEMRGSLPPKMKTVAGVRERVYKNSVYSIKHEKTNKIVYVCAEYATPLKTFQEVVKNRTAHTELRKALYNGIQEEQLKINDHPKQLTANGTVKDLYSFCKITEYYRRHKNDILLQFYLTLKQILEHENMDSMCELVFYEDRDENNKFHDVGRILLNRIVELKKERTAKDK